MSAVVRDGSVKAAAKNTAVGVAKGAGSFAVNTVKAAAAMQQAGAGNISGAVSTITSANPAALAPSNTTQAQVSLAAQVALTIGSLFAPIVSGEASAAEATTTVTHFTSDAGRAAISEAGTLNAGTWVTLPGEVPSGTSSAGVESLLEISPGKGTNSITFDTPSSNLFVPDNGPTTSGGAAQFQLKNPVPIDPTKFRPTDQ